MAAKRATPSWPQVAAFAVFVAGLVTVLVFVPADKLPSWEIVLGFASIAVGGGASAFLGPLLGRAAPAPTPVAHARERDTEGM